MAASHRNLEKTIAKEVRVIGAMAHWKSLSLSLCSGAPCAPPYPYFHFEGGERGHGRRAFQLKQETKSGIAFETVFADDL
jgi:hypothetical protein